MRKPSLMVVYNRAAQGHTREAGILKLRNVRVQIPSNIQQVFQALVEQAVSAQDPPNLLLCEVACHKLLASRHVHAIHVREPNWRGGTGKIHPLRTRPSHLQWLTTRSSACLPAPRLRCLIYRERTQPFPPGKLLDDREVLGLHTRDCLSPSQEIKKRDDWEPLMQLEA